MDLSTLTGSTLTVTTSISALSMTASTLTVSSINGLLPGTGSGSSAFSTLAVSSLNAASMVSTSSINVTTGNVGIGSTMPLQLLYVDNGNIGINSRNQISGGAALYFYNTPYGWSTAAKTAIITEGVNNYTMSKLHLCTNGVDDLTTSASVSNARLTVMPWGAVGINNTNPAANLDIIGSLRITSQTYAAITSGTGIDIIYSGGGTMSCGTRGVGGVLTAATMGYAASTHTFYTGTNAATNAMTINSSGQVGIGITPSYTLHVNGAIFAAADITAFSDQRYKQNIIRLDRSLDAIRSLSGYSYTREDYRPGMKQIGLLAQEVKAVIPEAVSYDSTNDIYSVNYNCLMAPVVESIKELYDQIQAQAKIIESQQAAIQKLLDRLGPE